MTKIFVREYFAMHIKRRGCSFSLAEVYQAIDSKVAAATLPASALSLLPVWKRWSFNPLAPLMPPMVGKDQ